MSNNKTEISAGPAVIAISQDENRLRAVCLQKQGGVFEVLWTKSSKDGQVNWRWFAAECNPPAEPAMQAKTGGDKIVIAGFNSEKMVFYHIGMPAVKEKEVASIVRLQAEARLPLPADQMELAWRAGKTQDGQVAVTIAAAKKIQLQKFVEDVSGFGPAKILLDCEAIVKTWREFFSGSERKSVVVSIGLRNTQVCLAEQGRLINAVSLDIGMEDFSSAEKTAEVTATTERFAQDMRSVLELFGCAEPAELPVFVLSDGDSAIEAIVSCLESAELNARAALPEVKKLSAQRELSVEDIYEYRVPIGLASMVLDGDTEGLNIFKHLYRPAGEKEKRHWLRSPKAACAIAAVMLALLVIVFYAVDVAGLKAIQKHLQGLEAETSFNLLVQRQELIKTIARQRPDMLKLLSEINTNEGKGITLDSLDFKKGRKVFISGQTQNSEQLYKFEESLLSKKGITNVKIQNTAKDSKSKKLKFTITFHYKSFTKKKT
jgi:hypothetical protein